MQRPLCSQGSGGSVHAPLENTFWVKVEQFQGRPEVAPQTISPAESCTKSPVQTEAGTQTYLQSHNYLLE